MQSGNWNPLIINQDSSSLSIRGTLLLVIITMGHLYHQYADNHPNAKWRLVPSTDIYGSAFELIDQKHNRAIVAGDVADSKLVAPIS